MRRQCPKGYQMMNGVCQNISKGDHVDFRPIHPMWQAQMDVSGWQTARRGGRMRRVGNTSIPRHINRRRPISHSLDWDAADECFAQCVSGESDITNSSGQPSIVGCAHGCYNSWGGGAGSGGGRGWRRGGRMRRRRRRRR